MTDTLKRAAAQAALKYIEPGMTIGIGTGTTVNQLIELLAPLKNDITTVASSKATEQRLKAIGIEVVSPNSVAQISLYIDGADEATSHGAMIKGGGGALTGEKIVAHLAEKFICMIEKRKHVDVLGQFPLPIEVIPLARSLVGRELVKLGGDPAYREGFVSDYGNQILDVYNLKIMEPVKLEMALNQIPGVVTNGIFAVRPADILLIAADSGVETIHTHA